MLNDYPDMIRLPIARGQWVEIHSIFPLTKVQWSQLKKALDFMEPFLTKEDKGGDVT